MAGFSACATGSPESLPDEFLGQWYYLGSSGGIAGTGMLDDGTGHIVIHSDNRIDHYSEDSVLVATTEFALSRGPTIFSRGDQWILSHSRSEEVALLSEDGQTMSLAENVYDGFARMYARLR